MAALVAVALAGCRGSQGSPASTARLTSPSPVVLNPADSKAADLRTRLDLLLGEHVIVIAKESSAAGSTDEYTSYLRLLTSNGNDLTELVRSALGDTAATRFDQIWSAQNDYLVTYTIALLTHDQGKADAAMSSLVGAFVPQFSQFFAAATQIPLDPITQLATEHVFETKAMLDDRVAQNYPKMFADLRLAYAQSSRIGDALAPRIAQKFADKFPGDAAAGAVDLRVSMNDLMQEHVYLATMATSAATGGRATEQAAAVRALADNGDTLGRLFSGLFGTTFRAQFDQIWAGKNTSMIAYASASTGPAKQNALGRLNDAFVNQFSDFIQRATGLASGTARVEVAAEMSATITVIDDQRSRSLTAVGADDRSSETSMVTVADLISGAAIAKLRSTFAP
ncbi:MAG: hypothetical protein M3082_16705 [Candidatus Dormibacteraeota bacterium]|nr:hypothetical protein [Candidatus Dormibacteraeota bacterium]